MPENPTISFCTVSMNRLHHLKQTLRRNMDDNKEYKNLEFVLLDYNSSDGTADWVCNELADYIQDGRLRYFRESSAQLFHRSHSRNVAFRVARGEILCNLDADNFTGKGFANYLARSFKPDFRCFLTPEFTCRDVIGRLVVRRNDFESVRGYDESMEGYGFEDIELYNRLSKSGVSRASFSHPEFLGAIRHSNFERFANESMGKNCSVILLRYLTPEQTSVTYIYADGRFQIGLFIDNEEIAAPSLQGDFGNKILMEREWFEGSWSRTETGFLLIYSDGNRTALYATDHGSSYIEENTGYILHAAQGEEFISDLKLLKTELENRMKMKMKNEYAIDAANPDGFGAGKIVLNFKIPIELN
jgi:hypothetical protein